MSHTPGPWHVESSATCGNRIVYGEPDAEGFSDDVPLGCHDYAALENLHLASTAPELLKTLQFIASIFEGEKIDGHDNCRCLVCEAIPTECDRAIAKATGGEK